MPCFVPAPCSAATPSATPSMRTSALALDSKNCAPPSPNGRRLMIANCLNLKQRCAGLAARAALCAVALFMAANLSGCKKSDGAATGGAGDTTAPSASTGKPLIVGFVYVGTKDDYGYNQAHADGAAAVKKISGVKVIENENVKENKDCQSAME